MEAKKLRDEIEITPQMIEAGITAIIRNLGGDGIGECTVAYGDAAEDVFRDMLKLSQKDK